MKTGTRNRAIVMAALAGMLISSAATAWYGGPWYRPYGSGAMVYKRQDIMRSHGYDMTELAQMLDGRRAFNRAEATRLARDIEKGFGDDLLSQYAPGTVVAGTRTAPWTWGQFGQFKAMADGARETAKRLAEGLENAPTNEQVREQGAWVTGARPGLGRWRHLDGLVSIAGIQAYDQLRATCSGCHWQFRTGRW